MEATDQKKRKAKIVRITLIVIGALVLGFALFMLYKYYFSAKSSTAKPAPKPKISDEKVANNLDGVKVDADKANRHPVAIMIENHPDARPQSGLDKAAIIYEAITEGGITRFMAVYGPYDAAKIGPVRSARTYYIDWLSEFNAYYAHVGGNLDALDKIKQDKVLDLDQFAVGIKAYWRIPQAGKAIEHTMYTSLDKLYQVAQDKHFTSSNDYTPLKFGAAIDIAKRSFGQNVTINFSAPQYKVLWTYDGPTNTYLRNMGGKAHSDAITGEQLKVSNVVVMQMNRWQAPTIINEQGWAMQTIGSDKVMIFSQGVETDGTWKKVDRTSRTVFYDSTGKEITFVPGKFWIEVVPPDVYSAIKIEAISAAS